MNPEKLFKYNLQDENMKKKPKQILHRSTVSDPFYYSLFKSRFFLAVLLSETSDND